MKNTRENNSSCKAKILNVPRGVKLDERALARVEHLSIEGVDGEIHGEGVRTAREGERGDGAEGHLSGEHVRVRCFRSFQRNGCRRGLVRARRVVSFRSRSGSFRG